MDNLIAEFGKVYRTKTGNIVKLESEAPRHAHEPILFKGSNGTVYDSTGVPYLSPYTQNFSDTDPLDVEVPEQEYLSQEFIKSLNTSPKEAFEKLRLWGELTFGPVTPSRIVERAQEEMNKELVREVACDEWTEKALEEAADVIVILTRAPGLWAAIERKMAINYNRKWNLRGDGTGYHIPKTEGIGDDVKN